MLHYVLARLQHSAWFRLLEPLSQTLAFDALNAKYTQSLQQAQAQNTQIFPHLRQIFRAFEATPFERLHTILLGQDPYPGTFKHEGIEKPFACGLSFSVPRAAPLPPSLRNIYQELHTSLNTPLSRHGDLSTWAHQGVLLLNSILSVPRGQSRGHANLGWEDFTDHILSALSQLDRPLLFIFLGRVAQEKKKVLHPNPKHLVLCAPHPSPLAQAHPPTFLGSGVFKEAQEFLLAQHIPMDWTL
ncbi:Uracil-DNA glycosylase, family 1 [Helicobacter heilmannii]|uniref:Uracil-DNA glycosylase n=2 Tax=Helicobacter heilmannii TaxID=35817 RepID=A0A0K2XG78_HELHE|nr:uracil-DNA glycosylase [Helicobacter heilmannii]CCM11351.1 Uracil-DNA glycosylase, family 1 [Helicobacter heilmannii ASB1.4]CRF45487.1 Uracil-DNA glycosylase, family 1 [Helicobacter heilmannii]CRF47495.1 Uracil-DNA glycosylase, family 1 [Helicobacter heilmannii]CRI34771.1 Uracil-DNA glycosylase, family 1 [Helicobacter heilmannii]